MTGPRVVSLFSGAGGLDLGIKRSGFDVILATDLDGKSAMSHRANFPETAFFEGSIADFTHDVAAGLVSEDALKDVDLLIGGPPCPPFSKSRFYRVDKPRAMDDPVGEVTISGYLNTLRWLKPKAFLLENVAGMAFNVHAETLQHIVKTAEDLGYKVEYRVLNAADYGVPQIRQRFILIGTLNGHFDWPLATHSDPKLLGEAPPWTTAGSVLGDLDTDENADDTGHFAGGRHHDLLKLIPPGDNYLFLTEKRGYPDPKFEWRKRYWSFLLKLSPEMPSWTIQARRSNNMGPLHWRNRILRIDEVKRLQTFPDDWVLTGKVEDQWRQVGNAVPPMLAEAIGRSLIQAVGATELLKVA